MCKVKTADPLAPKLCLGTHLAAKLQLGESQAAPGLSGFQAKLELCRKIGM
jgi:hypothetical protein